MSLTYPCTVRRALHSPCADSHGHTQSESLTSVQELAALLSAGGFGRIVQNLRDKDQTP